MNPMHRAIELSRTGLQFGGPFGAVVVRETEIIGEGFDVVPSQKDPTAHAAVMAIREACRFLKSHDLSGCELYASYELCLLCIAAIRCAGIRKVYYAAIPEPHSFLSDSEIRSERFVQVCESEQIAARVVFDAWPKSKE